MNYTELTTAIQDYTENTFTASQLATFVQQAEERIFNTVQFPSCLLYTSDAADE